MSLNFSLDNLKMVYVSSAKRGFLAVSDMPMCVTASGSSANHVIVAVKRVYRENGRWFYDNPERQGEWWLYNAWKEAIALTGGEPWRVYELDAEEVAGRLDAGEFTDDVRGFENRCEPWQPVTIDADGGVDGYATIAASRIWERVDGWRVVKRADGRWIADGSRCNADDSILRHGSPYHFDPLPDMAEDEVWFAMMAVDKDRPWE
jgi:hypothetical protein